MGIHLTNFQSSVTDAIRSAILEQLPDALVNVEGAGGHYTIAVTSAAFVGKTSLQRQRLVYLAVAPLMKGDQAPVHAVDRLETKVPGLNVAEISAFCLPGFLCFSSFNYSSRISRRISSRIMVSARDGTTSQTMRSITSRESTKIAWVCSWVRSS